MNITAPSPERLRELLARAGVESGAPFEAFAGEVLGRDGDCLLGCYSNAAHGYDARSTADLIAATLNALPALLHQLAEERELRMAVEQSWQHELARAGAAERARDEACVFLREFVDADARPNSMSARIAAFLAASGQSAGVEEQ